VTSLWKFHLLPHQLNFHLQNPAPTAIEIHPQTILLLNLQVVSYNVDRVLNNKVLLDGRLFKLQETKSLSSYFWCYTQTI
jgi:hypothetical protein